VLAWLELMARLCGLLAFAATAAGSCRVYRDDAPSRETRTPLSEPPAANTGAPAPVERTATSGPTSDALNLWVLNRPKGELSPLTAERPEATPPQPAQARPKAAVLAVLGLGEAKPCALHLARLGADRLAADKDGLQTALALLDAAWRWRWPAPSSTLSALMRSTAGHFGGVQSAPASAFSAALLRVAVARHSLLGGPRQRWQVEPSPPVELGSCDSTPEPALEGTIGVLVRTETGEFYGGVVNLDPLADAGSVSALAQYGVSLAVGRLGAVLLVADCAVPRPERLAERIYSSNNWARATAELAAPNGCPGGYALMTEQRVWVADGPLAWAVVEVERAPTSKAAAPTRSDLPIDAGHVLPDAGVQR
jgi:hypothetical protein